MTARQTAVEREADQVRRWHREAIEAAALFERRWTMRALRRIDPDIAQRIVEQRDLLNRALVVGDAAEVETHGAAMCRGWAAAIRVMEAAGEADDSYQVGFDPKTGTRVAIGQNLAGVDRVAEMHGDRVVFLTPDEVASLFSSVEGFKAIAAVKRRFPGAEVVDIRYRGEPAKADGWALVDAALESGDPVGDVVESEA
jgi:hypothetical protein